MHRNLPMVIAASVVLFCAVLGPLGAAQTSAPAALTGQVSSEEEGSMEGVLVSAKREASTVTITVASDAQGRYRFPRKKLEPGRYALSIRALGYEISDLRPVEITTQKTSQLDLKLQKTQDISSQLTNAEWFASMPGTKRQKMAFSECVTCHTLQRIVRSRYSASEFPQVLQKMRIAAAQRDDMGQLRPQRAGVNTNARTEDNEYLASVNLSKRDKWDYPLKELPRPKGKATRVIITEYDLPRHNAEPHDVVIGPGGMAWYADFRDQYLGRLDPKTAQVLEYPVPQVKPGFNKGMNDVEIDRNGTAWIALFNQPGLAKFDPETKTFQTWPLPKAMDGDTRRTVFEAPLSHFADGKIWVGGGMEKMVYRIDLRSGEWEAIDWGRDVANDPTAAARPHGIYGLTSDSKNNLYEFDIKSEYIVKVDAKTLKTTYYRTPTLDSGPRRGHMDSKDQLWFAEHGADKIAVFDTKTGRFQEWAVPTPFSNPYDAVADKDGYVWTGGMTSDRIARLNTKTGEIVEYLLPRSTNVRRVDVDNSTTPVTFWVGNNNGASIVKVEPLE